MKSNVRTLKSQGQGKSNKEFEGQRKEVTKATLHVRSHQNKEGGRVLALLQVCLHHGLAFELTREASSSKREMQQPCP